MMMVNNKELLLLMQPCRPPSLVSIKKKATVVRATALMEETTSLSSLTTKEKRELRKVNRDSKIGTYNWREDVEEKLLKKPKKQFSSWKEELNLDLLAHMGPQWWILKVSRAKGKDTVERMLQALHKNFPDAEFKVFTAAVDEKTKLKSGKISIKPKPLYPGCVFLHCILNRELHNFIKEDCEGVGGFIGRMVGNTKKQINKPRPVSETDMEAIFQEVKEKQEASDKAFEEEHLKSLESNIVDKNSLSLSGKKVVTGKTTKRSRKPSGPILGSTVRIVSGTFTDFTGTIKKLDKKRGLVTVGFTLFGKDTIADLNLSEIVEEQK
ncbi:plastid transcriptionally active 13 [Tanacetum coccineum]